MCLRPLPKREVVKLWASAAHPSARAGGKQLPPDWAAERHQPSDRHFVTGAQPPVPAKSKAHGLLVAQSCYRHKKAHEYPMNQATRLASLWLFGAACMIRRSKMTCRTPCQLGNSRGHKLRRTASPARTRTNCAPAGSSAGAPSLPCTRLPSARGRCEPGTQLKPVSSPSVRNQPTFRLTRAELPSTPFVSLATPTRKNQQRVVRCTS